VTIGYRHVASELPRGSHGDESGQFVSSWNIRDFPVLSPLCILETRVYRVPANRVRGAAYGRLIQSDSPFPANDALFPEYALSGLARIRLEVRA
jgi:hypothetical protein